MPPTAKTVLSPAGIAVTMQPMSAAPAQHDLATAPERPDPPRRWWLKRGLLALGLLVLSTIPVWFTWSCEAERRLQARLAESEKADLSAALKTAMDAIDPALFAEPDFARQSQLGRGNR